jgi:hypothetical protein
MYYGSSLIQHVYEARYQLWRAVHSHRARNGLLNATTTLDDEASSASGRSELWLCMVLAEREAHARTNAWKICLDVEGHQAVGRSVPSNIILDMHQVPVLEEGAVALEGSGWTMTRLIRYSTV